MTDYDPFEDLRLLDVEAYFGRLQAFCAMAGLADLAGLSVLAVGSALGGEAVAAARLGANQVLGLEIDAALVSRSQEIAMSLGLQALNFVEFDGSQFPPLDPVDIVLSGHVIEHTPQPSRHLSECLGVLRPGGYLFLEFPTRFHWRELHTGLASLEWLPRPLRNQANSLAGWAAALISRDPHARRARQDINKTLRQVSTPQVWGWIRQDPDVGIVGRTVPAPGIVRLCIRKKATAA